MKCFNHENIDAIGICTTCNKALCRECYKKGVNGLVCKENCFSTTIDYYKDKYHFIPKTILPHIFTYLFAGILITGTGIVFIDSISLNVTEGRHYTALFFGIIIFLLGLSFIGGSISFIVSSIKLTKLLKQIKYNKPVRIKYLKDNK